MNTMNAPVIRRLQITARGTLRSGRLASPPSVVALSNPTRLKMQITIAKSMPFRLDAVKLDLRRVYRQAMLEQHDTSQRQDACDRQGLEREGQQRGDADVLPCDGQTRRLR